jgi:cytoskeletal protein CcmA (bactofilin family)
MFTKPAKSTSASSTRADAAEGPAPVRRTALAASLIAENVTIKGDLTSDGDVQLDGMIHGDVKVGHLTIGETGQVMGAIEADIVDVRGRIAGSIAARQVRLFATGQMDGDITHTELAIDNGARFQGRSIRFQPATPAAAPELLAAPVAE